MCVCVCVCAYAVCTREAKQAEAVGGSEREESVREERVLRNFRGLGVECWGGRGLGVEWEGVVRG